MKFTHIITLSLLLLAACTTAKPAAKPRATIVDYIPAKEILPLPVSVESIDDKPTEYIVKTSLYYNGYDNYSHVKTKLTCGDGVKVEKVHPLFQLHEIDSFRSDFKLAVPADTKIVTCTRHLVDEQGTRIVSFSFNPIDTEH